MSRAQSIAMSNARCRVPTETYLLRRLLFALRKQTLPQSFDSEDQALLLCAATARQSCVVVLRSIAGLEGSR